MIKALEQGTILYHGSYTAVVQPDIVKCAKNKDFGQGFYLTTDKAQADTFAKIALQKAYQNYLLDSSQDFGVVSAFKYTTIESLDIKTFETADSHWLRCIVAHRKSGKFAQTVRDYKHYDIIGGKIANDNTNATIMLYMSGGYGTVGSSQAENTCISLLLPERLKDQYCFRTEKALSCLTFLWQRKIKCM
jgi:hypothetical protein